jgi:type VI secretion system secreted protein VgrG
MATPTQDKNTISVSTPLGKDKFLLTGLSGAEYVSDLFHFELTMTSSATDLDLTKVVGASVTVTMAGPDSTKRYLNGICTRMTQQERTYQAELRPWFWQLGLATDCKIFQTKSAPDIIKAVFSDLGFTDYKDSLTATYTARDYCVQYNETALAFVCRLMEEEGIFYFFTHADGKHTLVLADDSSAHANIAGTSTVPYLPLPTGKEWLEDDRIETLNSERQLVSGKYQADDFAFDTPSTQLKVNVSGDKGKQQIYEFPGLYQKKDAGDALGKVRLAELEAGQVRITGTGRARGFAAGSKFTLKGHPRTDLNTSYVLHVVTHGAGIGTYDNSFVAIPAATVFRPPRRTPKPRIASSQTALVVGKSGEEQWTDKYGRIKVQFHWDQLGKSDENSSCWVRVAQGWAGKNWGAFFLPRIGQEVVVSFLEGDPDRPLVTGSVYNGEQGVPYTLPADQTKSTIKSNSSKGGGGFNEIRFEDKKDSEEIYIHAQKDMNIDILNNQTITITKSRTVTISEVDDVLTISKGNLTVTVSEGNQLVTISKGNDTLTISEGDRTITVAKGKETHSVKGTRSVTVEGAETHTNKDKFTQTASGAISIKSDGNITIEAGGSLTLKAGTSVTVQAGTSLTAKGGTTAALEGGTAVTVKGSASGTVDGGGMLTVKGGMVKIN